MWWDVAWTSDDVAWLALVWFNEEYLTVVEWSGVWNRLWCGCAWLVWRRVVVW